MLDINSLNFTDQIIREIEFADNFYRSVDLKTLAMKVEEDLLNNRTCLFSTIVVSDDFDSFNDLKRVSINRTIKEDKSNNRLLSIDDLKYPPAKVIDKLYYNRANYKKQPIFYGGFGKLQALFENMPNTGDLFTLSTWRQKSNTKLHYAEIFHDEKVHRHTDLYKSEWKSYCELLQSLENRKSNALKKLLSLTTYFFFRPVDPSRKIEYLFSAFLTNKIFEMHFPEKIEAILYPSVQMEYISTNLAIKPESFDDKFEFVKAEEFIVLNRIEGKRQIISQKIAEANRIDKSILYWEKAYIGNDIKDFMKNNNVDLDSFK